MTEEQKQALIWRCRDAVAHLKQVVEIGIRGGRYSVTEYRYQLMINEIALASLTAQPVKRPKNIGPSYAAVALSTRDEQWYDAIAEAGYEVQE